MNHAYCRMYRDITANTFANFIFNQKDTTFKDSYMRTAYITNRPQGMVSTIRSIVILLHGCTISYSL